MTKHSSTGSALVNIMPHSVHINIQFTTGFSQDMWFMVSEMSHSVHINIQFTTGFSQDLTRFQGLRLKVINHVLICRECAQVSRIIYILILLARPAVQGLGYKVGCHESCINLQRVRHRCAHSLHIYMKINTSCCVGCTPDHVAHSIGIQRIR